MDAANNLDLMRYYKDRQVWLVEPDKSSADLSIYPPQKNLPAQASDVDQR